MEQRSHIISEQVFGSSKKIQLIGITPMESLLRAVDQARPISLSKIEEQPESRKSTMSIASLLDSNGESSRNYGPGGSSVPQKRRLGTLEDERLAKNSRPARIKTATAPPLPAQRMTTITCLHASVAQKSYGSEKRFLCPPPVVHVQPHHTADKPQVSMSIACESDDRPLERRTILDENMCGSFKYLHVTGTSKSKQFRLRVNLCQGSSTSQPDSPTNRQSPPPPLAPYASFLSSPISIISKPSKKTAKARNVSTCVLANAPVSLFNRINSQTVRTKYMTTENDRLCAKNSSWSPIDLVMTESPSPVASTQAATPITYGTEIILRDRHTGVSSPAVIIRKVDKGRVMPCAFGPVSQMQKIALQLASSVDGRPLYLSAAGSLTTDACHSDDASSSSSSSSSSTTNAGAAWLDFAQSRQIQPSNPDLAYEEVDDYLCWTIVSISTFEYTFYDTSTSGLHSSEEHPHPSSPYAPH